MIRLATDPHDRAATISAMASLDRKAAPQSREQDGNSLAKGYYGTIRSSLRASVPGGWASDHYEETLHFTGWNYIAGHATGLQCAAATVEVSRPAKGTVDAWSGKCYRMQFPKLGKHFGRNRYIQMVMSGGAYIPKSHDQDQTEEREVLPESFGLAKLMNRPNPSQSGGHLRYEMSVQLSQTGTALVVKVPNRFGKTVELYSIPTCLLTPRPANSQFPLGAYYVSPAATRTSWADDSFVTMVGYQRLAGTTIDMRDIIKISFPHPLWKDEGYSPLAAGSLWTDSSEQIDKSRFAKFQNQADPSLVITPPPEVNPSENEIARVSKDLAARYSGPANAGRVMVAPGGSTIDQIGVNPKDMDYGPGFDQLRNALMGMHGVPLIAAGITDGGSYAAFYAALKQFITLCVQPRLDWIAEELTYQLAEEYGDGLMVRLIAQSVDDPQVLESRLATDVAARSITKNEIRQMRGLEPHPDGDVWAGEHATESVKADASTDPGLAAQIAGTSGGSDEESTGIATGQDAPRSPAQHFEGARQAGNPTIGKRFKRLERRLARLTDALAGVVKGSQPPAGPNGNGHANGHSNGQLPKAIEDRLKGIDLAHEKLDRLGELLVESGRPGPKALAKGAPDSVLRQAIADAAKETNVDPTEAQKESGNYAKGKFRWHGLQIVIENPKGSVRRGTTADGKEWSQKMGAHYGYISRTEGADGDAVDVFIGPDPESELVFVIDQVRPDGSFDEHKSVIGVTNEEAAREIYLSCYEDGWQVGEITPMTLEQFREWIAGDTSQPLAMPKAFVKSWDESRRRDRSPGFERLAKAAAELWNGHSDGRNYP